MKTTRENKQTNKQTKKPNNIFRRSLKAFQIYEMFKIKNCCHLLAWALYVYTKRKVSSFTTYPIYTTE